MVDATHRIPLPIKPGRLQSVPASRSGKNLERPSLAYAQLVYARFPGDLVT